MEWPTIAFYRRSLRHDRDRRRAPRLRSPERLEGRSLLAAIVPTALPNDPSFTQQWALDNIGQYGGVPGNDVHAPAAWNTTTGSRSVVVAVIDSGIDLTHPDLAANVWTNPGEIAGNGLDDDHNGFVDDVHGWNFVDNNADVTDGFGHGTHVAGIIGAVGNNGVGVAGIAWQVSLMVLRVQNNLGAGSTSAVIGALNYATMMRRDHAINVVATNNSWETSTGPSVVVANAIRAQGDAGITFVAAAGNNASDNDLRHGAPTKEESPWINMQGIKMIRLLTSMFV
jgi:subtilisin family serine protease